MKVERATGSAAELHARALPEPMVPEVWVMAVDRPAIVLGSTQGDIVDGAAAARDGVEVVRRRSGGGAVLLVPGEALWIDVLLPRSDARWQDDVGRAAHWLGELWSASLADLGVESEVHRGALERTPFGRLVCFGAVGPGEVTVAGRKVIGISQRRTRAGARFQSVALASWSPAALIDLLHIDQGTRQLAIDDLADRAAGVGVALADLESAIVARLSWPQPSPL